MADEIFEHPRLAAIYDPLDPDRSDLDVYVAIAEELGRIVCWMSVAEPARSRCFWPIAALK
jgi:hypothetical protein